MKSRHAEITEDLRGWILGGEFYPGATLPTIRELAEAYETRYFTVQTALTPLVEEELKDAVERRQVQGILVPLCDNGSRRSLGGLDLPIAFVHGGVPNGVGFSTNQLLDLLLRRLRNGWAGQPGPWRDEC